MPLYVPWLPVQHRVQESPGLDHLVVLDKKCNGERDTVDGRNSANQLIWRISHFS